MQLLLFYSRDMIIELLTVNANTYTSVNTKIKASYLSRCSQDDVGEYYHCMTQLSLIKNYNGCSIVVNCKYNVRLHYLIIFSRNVHLQLNYVCYLFSLDTP